MLAVIVPLSDLAGQPSHPIVLPPPGSIPPPPGVVMPPIFYPPTIGGGPILPGTPEHPIAVPPGMIWPPPKPPEVWPQPPGKALVLVYIPGYGWKWVVLDTSLEPTPIK